MEENTNLKLRVQDESQKAKVLLERIESLFKSLPAKSQHRIERGISEKYLGTTALSHRVPLQDIEWKLELSLFRLPCSLLLWKGNITFWHPTEKEQLYGALASEPDWRELIDFVGYALNRVRGAFDEAFRVEIEQLDPDVAELSRALREAREFGRSASEKANQLQLREEALERAIKRSIFDLGKDVSCLRNTKTFLGKSKTIQAIREDIEKVVESLWKVAYPNTPPPHPDRMLS